jgi:hypothetical protein
MDAPCNMRFYVWATYTNVSHIPAWTDAVWHVLSNMLCALQGGADSGAARDRSRGGATWIVGRRLELGSKLVSKVSEP